METPCSTLRFATSARLPVGLMKRRGMVMCAKEYPVIRGFDGPRAPARTGGPRPILAMERAA